jgi:hypothetical protein
MLWGIVAYSIRSWPGRCGSNSENHACNRCKSCARQARRGEPHRKDLDPDEPQVIGSWESAVAAGRILEAAWQSPH